MSKRIQVLSSVRIPTTFFKWSIGPTIRRDLSSTRCLMNEITVKQQVRKEKSHRPKTLQDAFNKSVELQKGDSFESQTSDSPQAEPLGKQKVLDSINLGPKKPENWRTITQLPEWKRQKFALIEKFKGEKWEPKKKLSRQDMNSVKLLKQNLPEITTKELSDHFAISPEAIRRILKSKWTPTESEEDDLHERWKKRGEKIKGMMKEKFIPRMPKVVLKSTDGYTKVKFTKKNDLHTGEKKVKTQGAHRRIQKVNNRSNFRKMKF